MNYKDIVPDYNEYTKLQKTTFCSHEITVPKWEEGQKRYIEETFKDTDRGLKILDIACGDGVGLRSFKHLGFTDVIGIEFNEEKISKALESGYPVYQFDMHDLCIFPDKEFDIVYSSHTLEHAYFPEIVVEEFSRILKPNGKLYVVLPYPDYGDNKAHGGKFTLGTDSDDDGKKVVDFFSGFKLIKKKYDSFREPEIWLELELK